MAELEDNQYELGDLVFGDFTSLQVDDFEVGDADLRTGDVESPGEDGQQFGLDYAGGRVLTWEIFTDTHSAADSRQAWADMQKVWDARSVRTTPRQVMSLRMRLPGHDTVRVYGRPRRLSAAALRQRQDGVTDHVATFATADHRFYGDTEHALVLDLISSGGGGITWPVTWPITWAPGAERQDVVRNLGELTTWPLIRIDGPVAQPEVAYVGTNTSVRLDLSLASDEHVVIDTRPWVRTVRRQDGASLAGRMRGSRMANLALPVGQTTIRFTGTDQTGQASCQITYRNAYATP